MDSELVTTRAPHGVRSLLAEDGGGTVLIFRDEATGERAELTREVLGSWVARTASLLRDGCGLRAGDRVAVMLPAHWQTAAVLLGAWSIGLSVSVRPWATAGLTPRPEPDVVDAVFVARGRLGSWLEEVPAAAHRFVLDLASGGASPFGGASPAGGASPSGGGSASGASGDGTDGYRDYLAEVSRYPDPPPAYEEIVPDASASPDGTSFRELAGIAHGIATLRGLRAGDRLLIDTAVEEQPLIWLLAPLSAGASVVLCANLRHGRVDDIVAAEGINHPL